MIVKVHHGTLHETRWHEYAIRFIAGGLVTAAAGVIAKKFGPDVGGLFLAFPAIFPASATLLQKHEERRKQKAGVQGAVRARKAVAADACGAELGSVGLMAFAVAAWKLLPLIGVWGTDAVASVIWATIAATAWFLWKRF